MERIQALIDKLYKQKQENCNPGQMLLTVQMLQSELLKLQQKNGTLGTAKVAVTLPVNMNFTEEVVRAPKTENESNAELQTKQPSKPDVPQTIERSAYMPKENPVAAPITKEEAATEQPAPAKPSQQVLNPAF